MAAKITEDLVKRKKSFSLHKNFQFIPYLAITGGAGSGALSAAGYTGNHGAEQARLSAVCCTISHICSPRRACLLLYDTAFTTIHAHGCPAEKCFDMAALSFPDLSKNQPRQHPALRTAGVQLQHVFGCAAYQIRGLAIWQSNPISGKPIRKAAQKGTAGSVRRRPQQCCSGSVVEFVTKTFPSSRDDAGGVVLLNNFAFPIRGCFVGCSKKRCGKDKVVEIKIQIFFRFFFFDVGIIL